MNNERELGERGEALLAYLAGGDGGGVDGSYSATPGVLGAGPYVPLPAASLPPLQTPSPVRADATVPAGASVTAAADAFTVPEGTVVNGSLLVDNGSGTDVAPSGTDVTVVQLNGLDFTGSAAIETALGGLIVVDSQGNISIDPGTGYEQLAAGEQVVETFTYTLAGGNEGVAPGIFEAVVNVSALTSEDGFVINGAAAGGFFGIAVAGVGDVNQDGFHDILVGGYLGGASNQGRAYIVFGGDALGAGVTVADGGFGPNGLGGFAFAGTQGNELLGQAVGGGGDYNDDGIADLLIASPRFDTSGTNNAGKVEVIFGGQGTDNVARAGFSIFGTGPNTYAGITTANAGDVNNDGIDDILVGAWPADPSGLFEAGEIYVVYGQDGTPGDVDVSELDGEIGFTIEGVEAGDRAGTAVAAAGDFNGDGVKDIIVGATHADPGGNDTAGSAYVIFGGDGFGSRVNLADADFRLDGVAAGDYLGRSVSSAGDLNGDGVDDIAVGAFNTDVPGAASAGAVHVVFGGQNVGGVLSAGALNGTNGFTIRGFDALGQAGVSVSSAGDVNADGIADLLIGAHAEGADNAGAAYVVFGSEGGFGATIDLSSLDGTNGFRIAGAPGQGYLGWSVAGVGDVNGDNVDDIAVTAFGAGGNTGQTYIIYGRGTPLIGMDTATVTVTFVGENDAPVATDDIVGINEEGVVASLLVLDNDTDIDGDALTVSELNGVAFTGSRTVTEEDGSVVSMTADGDFAFTPSPGAQALSVGEVQTVTYTYTVTDGTVTDTGTITINITGANDAPVADNLSFPTQVVEDGQAVTLAFSADDVDSEDTPATLVYTVLNQPTEGTVANNNDGTFSFDPGAGFQDLSAGATRNVTFNYQATDSQGVLSNIATVTITVTGTNDAPAAVNDQATATSGGTTVTGNVLTNDTDVDTGDTLMVVSASGGSVAAGTVFTSNAGALVVINADGTFGYDPTSAFPTLPNGQVAIDTISYTISDGQGGTATANLVVTVTGTAQGDLAVNDAVTTGFGGTIATGSVVDNDNLSASVVKVNGDSTLVAEQFVLPSGATLTVNTDGTFSYEVPGGTNPLGVGQVVYDSFSYRLDDGTIVEDTPAVFDVDVQEFPYAYGAIGEQVGWDVTVIGDINGDGFDEIAISAPFVDSLDSFNDGKVYILFGGPDVGIPDPVDPGLDLATLDPTEGFVILGEAYSYFGTDLTALGDVNGDGLDDFAVAAGPTFSQSYGSAPRAVYVIYGRDGVTDSFASTENVGALTTAQGYRLTSEDSFASFGRDISWAGDVNGDGFNDLIISSEYYTSGNAFVVLGMNGNRASATVQQVVANGEGIAFEASVGGYFGSSVAGVGDINGDGFDDVLVGYQAVSGGTNYVFGIFGGDEMALPVGDVLVTSVGGFLFGGESGQSDNFGYSIAGLGDVNGDGIDDFIVGAPTAYNNLGYSSGVAYVVFGRDSEAGDNFASVFLASELDGQNGFVLYGENNSFNFGRNVEYIGDINGDGINEIGVGHTTYGELGSRSYLVFGREDGYGVNGALTRDVNAFSLNGDRGFIFEGGDGYYTSASLRIGGGADVIGGNGRRIGDVDGDGFDDVLLSDPYAYGGYAQIPGAGAAGLLVGRPDLGRDPAVAEVVVAIQGPDPAVTASTGRATSESDVFTGSLESDIFDGLNGNDTINGRDGDDVLIGNGGSDYIVGGDGDDLLIGDQAPAASSSATAPITASSAGGVGFADIKPDVTDQGPARNSQDPWVSSAGVKGGVVDSGPAANPVGEPDFADLVTGSNIAGGVGLAGDDPYDVGPVTGVDIIGLAGTGEVVTPTGLDDGSAGGVGLATNEAFAAWLAAENFDPAMVETLGFSIVLEAVYDDGIDGFFGFEQADYGL